MSNLVTMTNAASQQQLHYWKIDVLNAFTVLH